MSPATRLRRYFSIGRGSGDAERQDLAVNNALNNLLGYPHGKESSWSEFISADPTEVADVLARWRGDDPDTAPRAYFDRLA